MPSQKPSRLFQKGTRAQKKATEEHPTHGSNHESTSSRYKCTVYVLLACVACFSVNNLQFKSQPATIKPTLCKEESPPIIAQQAGTLMKQGQYRLNDPTIRLSPYVARPWLEENQEKPAVKLVLTNFGWNNLEHGMKFYRSIRSREMF